MVASGRTLSTILERASLHRTPCVCGGGEGGRCWSTACGELLAPRPVVWPLDAQALPSVLLWPQGKHGCRKCFQTWTLKPESAWEVPVPTSMLGEALHWNTCPDPPGRSPAKVAPWGADSWLLWTPGLCCSLCCRNSLKRVMRFLLTTHGFYANKLENKIFEKKIYEVKPLLSHWEAATCNILV